MKKRIEDLQTYEILEQRESKDLSSTVIRLRHKKTGAKIALISNEDDNKVFYIGFRTPPADSTGVAHILEHSTLCGSKNYPVKDPFVELTKGSLNTFLNAMTYPDKTVYPLASCNDTDFRNLMLVYLDAVFNPLVYENESIFRQEGWHYEFDEEGKPFVNGVVYNEMKGALSTPDDILDREVFNSLFPDTCYGVESGGDPEFIPDLTYEAFLDFHRKYYHPSNSYIYLYGDMDMAEQLELIDERYLSKYDALSTCSMPTKQKAFDAPVHVRKSCPLGEGEDPEDNTFLTLNYVLKDSLDRDLYVAFKVLDYALCSAPGAPVKKALVDAGVGKDVYTSYQYDLLQPYFGFTAKGTILDREEDFLRIIREVLSGIVRDGFDKKSLLAAINRLEFNYREADSGYYPKGLLMGLKVLDSWLYAEDQPFIHIEADDTYARLREYAQTDYFEQLVQTWFLDNPHCSILTLEPKAGVEEAREARAKARVEQAFAAMSKEEVRKVHETFDALRAFQDREDTPEELATIPLLSREDLTKKARPLHNEEGTLAQTPMVFHPEPSRGISYLGLLFDMDQIPGEYYPYAALLKEIWGMVDTDAHSYNDLNNEINLVTGGAFAAVSSYMNAKDPEKYRLFVEYHTKYFYDRGAEAIALIEEILLTSHLEDTDRIREILEEIRSQTQAAMLSAGHRVALGRAQAGVYPVYAAEEELSGLQYYRFLCDLLEHYEERKDDMVRMLRKTVKALLRPENLLISLAGEEAAKQGIEEAVSHLKAALSTEEVPKEHYVPALITGNEGFMTAGQVQFVCRAGSFRSEDLPYTGALRALKVYLGYQYLWINIRVKGGAYGCFGGAGRSGLMYLNSYRDPKLRETDAIYQGLPEDLRNLELDERGITQLIIGAVSDLDIPLTPLSDAMKSMTCFLSELSEEDIQQDRDQLLQTTPEDMRALAEYADRFLKNSRLVVVGNAAKVKECADMFDRLENLN
ncbi:MAG: insulinase family protein [Lachnospiraceae bacterium]|nr:insulinase family protein [Lachnospiraceae bacterium]